MFEKIKHVHYKQLFLYGFYISYIGITSLATLIDFAIGNGIHALVDFISVLIAILAFFYYRHTGDEELASIVLFWIASCVILVFVVHSEFGMSVIFTPLIPMVAFILLSTRTMLRHVSSYFMILALVFLYGYTQYDQHPLLYDIKPMSTYVIALLFVIAFGTFYHIAIEQYYRQLEGVNRQKTFLLKEVHHRVKNNLNIIASILGLQRFESENPEVHALVDQNRLRLESIAMAHEILYKQEDLEHINFETYITKLSSHIVISEGDPEKITIEVDTLPIELSIESMIQFGIIINELITNSLKYAFKDTGVISISLKREEDHYIFLYHDNGIGLAPTDTKIGFGQNLIKLSTQHLHGSMEVINEEGLTYRFRFTQLQ